MNEEALAQFAKQRDALFETARGGGLKDVMALGCPACGGALVVYWMRQLVPVVGRDALHVRCSAAGCNFSIQADGRIPRPAWAGFFSGTLTTTPAALGRARIGGGK